VSQISTEYKPSEQVGGGDFYDAFAIERSRLLGGVAGKGDSGSPANGAVRNAWWQTAALSHATELMKVIRLLCDQAF